MGWASGTGIARTVAEAVLKYVADPKVRLKIYTPIIEELEDHSWDTQDEALDVDPIFDKALGFDMTPHKFKPWVQASDGNPNPTISDPRTRIICRCCGLKPGHKLHQPVEEEDNT